MTAIVGVWNRDGRPIERRLLIDLGETMAHRGPETQGIWIQSAMGMTARLVRVTPESGSETQPALHPSGSVVAFDGRLDNRTELLSSLRASTSIHAGAPDSALVLAAYELYGDRLPQMLLGDFALALFDPGRGRLLLARDVIGLRTLYYWRGGNTIVFASEIKAILAHPAVATRPNEEMIALMAARRLSAEDVGFTFFDDVFNLPPGHSVIAGPESFSVKPYWEFDLDRQIRLKSFRDYVDGFRHYFDQAVRRRIRSAYPVAVTVSGGLDSSSIFCLAKTFERARPQESPELVGVTYSSDDGSSTDESTFVRAIEDEYSAPVLRVNVRRMSLLEGADEQIRIGESPILSVQWQNFSALLQLVRASGGRVLLVGTGADEVLADQAYLVDLVGRFKWRTAWTHLREAPRWFTDASPGAFRDIFLRDVACRYLPAGVTDIIRRHRAKRRRNVIPAWYSDALKTCVPVRAGNGVHRGSRAHSASFDLWLRSYARASRLEWTSKAAASYGIEIATPFLDRDLVSFLMAIPGEVHAERGVPKALLREAMRGVLPLSIVERRSKADWTENMNEGVLRELPEIAQLLQAGQAAERGYVSTDAVVPELAWLKDQLRDSMLAAVQIRDVVALELWLHVFCLKP